MTRQAILDKLGDDEQVIFLEGPEFDKAIMGLIERFGSPPVVCYGYHSVIKVLRRQGMSHEDAEEYFQFNIIGAWMGEQTPAFLMV